LNNISIYDILNEPLKLKPPIKMFEAFSGIGTQAIALKRLNIPYEIVGFSEIDKFAIKSYHAIHGNIKNYGDITKMGEIPPCDIFTWSFPCTDLSKAGKMQGMTKDTRSGLVFEVLRLVRDTKNKPKVLIMENVIDLIQKRFKDQFLDIIDELETYGYNNYYQVLNAKDFGVAQNRKRVFMVSVLGDYTYNFPKPFQLENKLKDYLEEQVDEKYFLSEKFINYLNEKTPYFDRSKIFKKKIEEQNEIATTITTREGDVVLSNFIAIPDKTKSGFAIAEVGDGIYIDRPHQKRGVVQKGMIQTLKTTVSSSVGVVLNDLKIRKLTPKECWRLMGIDDEDFEKAQKVCSNSQLYKQAGNAIVVNVFENILREMIDFE
jgi:DNA (cytosine-5)-methyltransferase 1